MKFECGKKNHDRATARQEWHPWFAWYPVRVATFDCRWLEHVERKGLLACGELGPYWSYQYRSATPTTRETA